MELILGLLSIAVGLGSLVCCIIVTIGLWQDKGPLWAILGFCCCQLIVFIYGWAYWVSDKKMPVMIIWTLMILISIAIQVGAMMMGIDLAGTGGGY
ncbi:MAG: hypothetical protein KF858_10350 [Candidatus Sumerlaeia bacterium]|nr:hypothetical protein [Candidatus Sumerlaeia bacterium]